MKGLEKIIPKLEIVVCGLLWYIWSEARNPAKGIDELKPYEEDLEAAYQAGDKKRFNQTIKKAMEEKHG